MPIFDIFPGGGFDTSILTVVFLGLIVRWMFTETLGFTFVGLVVPGYLASVFVISPVNGAVIVVESVITYLLVRALADGFAKTHAWSNMFGRDRFFAFLFVSVFVRLVSELWWWPAMWNVFAVSLGSTPDLPPGLNSVGLVLVPLTANMFWKVGLRRGIWQVGLPTVLVFLITVYFLDPFTNLRFSEFRVHYEDAAIDMLSSPKPYIIMLVTASIAARANLSYGWDFGGILIPALIAVTWQDPGKAMVTVAEALVLAAIGTMVLESKFAKSINFEGPRKIVVLFTLGFFLKFLFAWVLNLTVPHARVIDFFGFGYLLSTLLALKIVQKKSVPGVLIPTLIISVVGLVAALVIISVLPVSGFRPSSDVGAQPSTDLTVQQLATQVVAHTAGKPQYGEPVKPRDIGEWRKLMAAFMDPATAESACDATALVELGLNCVRPKKENPTDPTTYFVSEPAENFPNGRGWGVYWFAPSKRGPAVVSRTANADPNRVAAILEVANETDASLIAISSASRTPTTSLVSSDDRVASPHAAVVGQIKPRKERPIVEVDFANTAKTIVGKLPATVELGGLAERLGQREGVDWETSSEQVAVRFVLSPRDVIRLLASRGEEPGAIPIRPVGVLYDELYETLFGDSASVPSNTQTMSSNFSAAELHNIEVGVVRPLLEMAVSPPPDWAQRLQWDAIQSNAAAHGLVVEQLHTNAACWNLVREIAAPFRAGAVVFIRCERRAPVLIEITRPHREVALDRAGLLLAEEIGASAIVVGAVVRDPESDTPVSAERAASLLTVAHRAFHEPSQPDGWTIQLRGVSRETYDKKDAVLSFPGPVTVSRRASLVGDWLRPELDLVIDDGQPEFVGIRYVDDDTARYASTISDGRFARLWLTTTFRHRLIESPQKEKIVFFAERSGIALRDGLGRACESYASIDEEAAKEIQISVNQFSATLNPVWLDDAVRRVQNVGAEPQILRDKTFGMSWFSYCGRIDRDYRVLHKLAKNRDGKSVTFEPTPFDLLNGTIWRGTP